MNTGNEELFFMNTLKWHASFRRVIIIYTRLRDINRSVSACETCVLMHQPTALILIKLKRIEHYFLSKLA